MPGHGLFVAARLRKLKEKYGESVEIKVVAPIPWYPAFVKGLDRWVKFVGVPTEDIHSGLTVRHPRYPIIPKIGMSLAPILLAIASIPELKRVQKKGFDFDLID